jgi:hypothetical protein
VIASRAEVLELSDSSTRSGLEAWIMTESWMRLNPPLLHSAHRGGCHAAAFMDK